MIGVCVEVSQEQMKRFFFFVILNWSGWCWCVFCVCVLRPLKVTWWCKSPLTGNPSIHLLAQIRESIRHWIDLLFHHCQPISAFRIKHGFLQRLAINYLRCYCLFLCLFSISFLFHLAASHWFITHKPNGAHTHTHSWSHSVLLIQNHVQHNAGRFTGPSAWQIFVANGTERFNCYCSSVRSP